MLTRARAEERCSKRAGESWGLATATLALFLLCGPVFAAPGLDYLSSQQHANGSFGNTPTSLAVPVQTTAEVLRAYQLLDAQGHAAYGTALNYLNAEPELNTEFLARKILVNGAAGADASPLIDALLLHQNADGGFGDQPGYASSVLDTAYALQALGAMNYDVGVVVPSAAGYLLNRQASTGGWSDSANTPSVFVTAQVVRALSRYRTTYQGVGTALTNAQTFLLAQRTTGGLWAEALETALALVALNPIADRELLDASFTSLEALQQADGSWVNDAYTTALALQAIALRNAPAPDPTRGMIQGQAVDALTGVALAGVTVTLSGGADHGVTTDGSGAFRFANLAFGNYTLMLSLSGYATITTQTRVNAGQLVDLGAIALVKSTDATTGTVRGTVTDAQTGQPLSGVAIVVTGATPAVTDAGGAYQIANVPPGAITVTAAKAGYTGASGAAGITAGGIVIFSPALSAQSGDVTLQGRVIDGTTGAPLGGVTVNLSGPVLRTLVTGADGRFNFTGLPGGSYTLSATTTGFFGLSASIAVNPGSYDLGDLGLSTDAPATAGTLRGTVTDAQTGAAIAGATVVARGSSATTDADGAYVVTGLSAGDVVIQVSSPNYVGASATGEIIAGGIAVFSPALTPLAAQETAIEGTVRDGVTNAPLAGVAINVSGGSSAAATTNAQGSYRVTGLNAGVIVVSASLGGYDTVTGSGSIATGATINFSPRLFAADSTPPDANATGIRGVVLDAGTSQPLAGAMITASGGDIHVTADTDGAGAFLITGLDGEAIDLTVTAGGYVPANLALTLEPLKVTDIGQVRLRRGDVTAILPDLVVTEIDGSQGISDPHTFAVSGTVTATVANHGTANSTGVAVLAFQDTDRNGRYDPGLDITLGEASLGALGLQESQALAIPLAGNLTFRDAPISVHADGHQVLVESNESNNVGTTAGACVRVPEPSGQLTTRLKWHWRGPSMDPSANNVFGPPVVARLTDTNGDGRIDEGDAPNVVFTSFRPGTTTGVLNVINGVDGSQIWANATADVTFYGSAALADIDGDGLVDIVISNRRRTQLLAFNHDGSIKWSVPTAPTHPDVARDGIAIADLDGDGSPEIIHGRRVYNSSGTLKWAGTQDHGGETGYGVLPIAADVNLDGSLEVVAGRTLYAANGNVIWHRANIPSDGFNAVGNFDDDEFAEIVLVANGRVYLLQHTGETVWGPVLIPGGGFGGAPTVADFDGDGRPEIGVAGAANYVVFDTDGSILWTARTQDTSSHRTGSSVFDFDGDGKAEILYADEVNFFVFDGATGQTRLRIPNGSGTTLEYPIVVDVDANGAADVIVTSNTTAMNGVRAFESGGDPWLPTRTMWNQHSYHIDNINDDGSVPPHEQPSWLSHNTYRLNTLTEPDRTPLSTPDLTASLLRFAPGGPANGPSLSVRIGNAGARLLSTATARFYEGDPSAGGRLLGEAPVPALATGEYADVSLPNVTGLSGGISLYAVADPSNAVVECREDNNSTSIPGPALFADLVVAVDTASVTNDPQTLAVAGTVQATVSNAGTLGAAAGAELLAFYDLDGDGVYGSGVDAVLGTATLGTHLPVGASATVPIGVSGTSQFRDMPIKVWVDSAETVVESNETNNVASAAAACAVTPSIGNLLTNPNDPRNWLGATVGTFAALFYGSNTPATRQRVIDNELLVDGIFDPTGAVPATLISAGGSGGCLGTSTGSGLDYFCASGGDVSFYANAIDNRWFQTSGIVGQTVFDLNFDASKVAVFNSIDHGPLPQEAIESTVYLSNDRISWTEAITERVWLEGYLTDKIYDGFVYVVGTGTGETFRYVSIIHGGPGALIRDGDNEINGLLGLRDDLRQSVPDLTASLLRIMDQGTGQGIRLSLRVGNAGLTPVASAGVAFYDGDPANGGVLLGTTTVNAIPATGFKDVVFDSTTLPAGTRDIYAVVDGTNAVAECREDNNVTHIAPVANVRGAIAVATDEAVYGPGSAAVLQGLVTNTGALPASYSADLRVEDLQGAVVEAFAPQTLNALSAGASVTVTNVWNTGTVLSGTYRLRGQLRDAQGGLISESVATFEIRHGDEDQPRVTLRTTTDRPTYNITDLVNIDSLIANPTPNALIDGTRLRIRIKDPAGAVIFTHEGPLGQLPPGALRSMLLPYGLNSAPVGTYRIEGEILDAATGAVLAASTAQCRVINDLAKNLAGQVAVANPTIEIGTAQLCTYTVTNRSPLDLTAVELRLTTVNLLTGNAAESVAQFVNLAAGGTQTILRSVGTGSFTAGDYACALEARVDGVYRSLGFAPFRAVEPPVRIHAVMALGNKGRLLILLDDKDHDCHAHDHADHGYDKDPERHDHKDADGGHDKHKDGHAGGRAFVAGGGHGSGHDDDRDGHKGCNKDGDPYGPKDAPALSAQRVFLENLLNEAGWSYTITDDADAFTRALRSGGYTAYALFSEQEQLSEQAQKELREAVFRGEGLVVAGSHDNRNHVLNDALGIKRIGRVAHARAVDIPDGPLGPAGTITLIPDDHVYRIKRTTAERLATYQLSGHSRSSDYDCRDEDKEDYKRKDHPAYADDDDCHRRPDEYVDAVTLNAYGSGRALFAGFDLLAQAAKDGNQSFAAQSLLAALGTTHPVPKASLGGVVPVELTLTNQGVATAATAEVAVPSGAAVVDARDGQVQNGPTGQYIAWTVSLGVGEERRLTFYIRLPDVAADLSLQATVTAVAGNVSRTVAQASLDLTVDALVSLDQLLLQAGALAQSLPAHRHALRAAAADIDRALAARTLDKAVDYVLKATDHLLGIGDPAVTELRRGLDEWLRYTLMSMS